MKVKVRNRIHTATVLVLLILLFAGAALAEPAGETRSTATSEGKGIERGKLTDGAISFDEHDALITEGQREQPIDRENSARPTTNQKLSATTSQSPNTDFWFFDATVDLFSDLDGDGYYFGIDLNFDADTLFVEADVYAVIYLSFELGPWNEYAETDIFTIFGATGDDAYTVETELVSGYLSGEYDILIELYDALDDSLVATFGPEDTSELAFLPLEDAGRDAPADTIVVVESGGGGSLGWLMLLALGAFAWRRNQLSG